MLTCTDILEQGQVPALLSIDQMRNLTRTPQCDKITSKAFGMIQQPAQVSNSGHALATKGIEDQDHTLRTSIAASHCLSRRGITKETQCLSTSAGSRDNRDHRTGQPRQLPRNSIQLMCPRGEHCSRLAQAKLVRFHTHRDFQPKKR